MKIFYSSYDQPNQTFQPLTPKYILLLLFQNYSFLVLVPTRISFTNPLPFPPMLLPSSKLSLPLPPLPCTLTIPFFPSPLPSSSQIINPLLLILTRMIITMYLETCI